MDELEVNELDTVEGYFDDYVSEETAEDTGTEEPDTEAESEAETPNETPEDTSFLRVKFNGEERDLTEEEARVLAQKGLNYDRFYEPIERLARANDMSVGDYVNSLNDTQTQYEVEKEKESLRSDPRYENLDDEILTEIASSRVRDFNGQRDQYLAEQARKEAEAKELQAKQEIDHFLEEYPEYRNKGPESLDPKVFEFVKQGYTLLEAYSKFQRMNAQKSNAEAKAKVNQLNEENKKKSLGNTSNAGKVEADDFLTGFLNS